MPYSGEWRSQGEEGPLGSAGSQMLSTMGTSETRRGVLRRVLATLTGTVLYVLLWFHAIFWLGMSLLALKSSAHMPSRGLWGALLGVTLACALPFTGHQAYAGKRWACWSAAGYAFATVLWMTYDIIFRRAAEFVREDALAALPFLAIYLATAIVAVLRIVLLRGRHGAGEFHLSADELAASRRPAGKARSGSGDSIDAFP